MAQKSMQAKLDEALSRMAFLEGELTKRGHMEPAIQNQKLRKKAQVMASISKTWQKNSDMQGRQV